MMEMPVKIKFNSNGFEKVVSNAGEVRMDAIAPVS